MIPSSALPESDSACDCCVEGLPAGSCRDGRSPLLDIGRETADRCQELWRPTLGHSNAAATRGSNSPVSQNDSRSTRGRPNAQKLLIKIAAWASLCFIAYATLSPLRDRPTLLISSSVEHLAAFAVFGALLLLSLSPAHSCRPRRLA